MLDERIRAVQVFLAALTRRNLHGARTIKKVLVNRPHDGSWLTRRRRESQTARHGSSPFVRLERDPTRDPINDQRWCNRLRVIIQVRVVYNTDGSTGRHTHLNGTQHREKHILEWAIVHKHHQRHDDKYRVQQGALERHRHVPEVKCPLLGPERAHDCASVHPESDRDEAGRANVHRSRTRPVTETGHLDRVRAVDGTRRRAHDEPGDGGAEGDEVEGYGHHQHIHVGHADNVASVELLTSQIQLFVRQTEEMETRTRKPSEAQVFKTNATLTMTIGHGDNASGP